MSNCTTSRIQYAHKLDGCKSKGGLIGVALATWTGGTGAIGFLTNANELITGVTNSASTKFYFQAQYPEKALVSVKNDTSDDRLAGGYIADGSFYFLNMDYLLRKKTTAMVDSQTFLIAKYANGTYRLFGDESGCYCNTDEQSGTALKDLNGVTVSFQAKSTYSPKFMDATLAEALFDYDTVIA